MVNYEGFGEVISSDMDFGNRLPKTDKPASLTIRKGSFELPFMQATNVFRAGEQAHVGLQEGIFYVSWGHFGQYKISSIANIQYQNTARETAPLFLLSEVLGIACWLKGKFVLHAGAVAINGKAHIFAGTPGMGKSTSIASLWQLGAIVLSDDLVLIDFIADGINCVPTLPEIKVWEESADGLGISKTSLHAAVEGKKKYLLPTQNSTSSYPIASINIISNEPMESFAGLELLKYFPLPNQLLQGEQLKRHFKESLIIQKNCEINLLKPKSSFLDLQNWAKQFFDKNA